MASRHVPCNSICSWAKKLFFHTIETVFTVFLDMMNILSLLRWANEWIYFAINDSVNEKAEKQSKRLFPFNAINLRLRAVVLIQNSRFSIVALNWGWILFEGGFYLKKQYFWHENFDPTTGRIFRFLQMRS